MAAKRNTIQRALVLETVLRLRSHVTADEVYQEISPEHPHISRATVYRNLHQLAQSGEIRRLEVPGGADRFDYRPHDHYHARCLKCGRVFDMEMEYIEDLAGRVTDTQGFTITGHEIMFKGFCPQCREDSRST